MVPRLKPIALFISLVAVATLSGCEPSGLGPAAISDDDGSLAIAVCHDVTLTELYGEMRTVQGGRDWIPFLDVKGELALSAGDVIRLNDLPDGLEGRLDPIDLSAVTDLAFTFTDSEGGWGADFGDGDALALTANQWLQTGGATTSQRCGD